jgi:hypothetical protein
MSTPPGVTAAFSAGVDAQGWDCARAGAGRRKARKAATNAASRSVLPVFLESMNNSPSTTFPQARFRRAERNQGGGVLVEPVTVTLVRLSALS